MTIGLAISFYHHFQTMKAVLQTSMAVDQTGLFQKRTVLFFWVPGLPCAGGCGLCVLQLGYGHRGFDVPV